jgi:hypothetical protein
MSRLSAGRFWPWGPLGVVLLLLDGKHSTNGGDFAMPREEIEALEATQGEKMIEIKLRFWTNKIAPEESKVIPKHAWAAGVVRMERNRSHGIEPGRPAPFHSLLDVGAVIEKTLIEHGVILRPHGKMKKYFKE